MPYHIDEENSELVFEVHDGNKLTIKLKSSGSVGSDIYIVKVGDSTNPTDNNVFSASRVLAEIENAVKNVTPDTSFWELKEDSSGNKYISTKYDAVSEKGITAYASSDVQVPSIFDGLPLDNVTIHKNPDTGLIEVIGGTGEGGNLDSSSMWSLLGASTSEQINASHLTSALSGYATQSSLDSVSQKLNDFLEGSDTDTIINKWKELEAFLSGLSESDNLSEILSNKADKSELEKYVTIATEQGITGLKHFINGLSVGSSKHRIYEQDGVVYLDGDLAVTGGITAYALGDTEISTIMDGVVVDGTTIAKVDGVLKVLNAGGGEAGSVSWDNINGKPSWIGATKPTYNWSEILAKPTTLAGIGITDAYNKSESDGRYLYKYSNNYSGDVRNIPINTFVSAQNGNITNSPSDLNSVAWSDILTFAWNDNSQYKEQILISNGRLYSQGGYGGGWSKIAFITDTVASSSRLTTDAGSSVNPVYFANGIPVAGTYTFGNGNGNAAINNGTLCSNLNADMLDGRHYTDFIYRYSLNLGASDNVLNIPSYTYFSGINMINSPLNDWLTGLVLSKNGNDYYKEIIGISSGRLYTNYGGNSSWNTVAFISDNVASATKLQTARTLWGQSFDGTANVSGNMKDVGSITASGDILTQGGMTCYSSDERAKTILEELNLSLKEIAESPTIRFKWNGWKIKDDGKTHIGGIAQYVQKLLPETILEADGMLNLDYATTAYIYAVQTARHLNTYETRTDRKIKKLEKEIKILKHKLKQLGYEEINTLAN